MSLRIYLWTEDGPWRLPKAFFDLQRALPQYAGTRQKAIEVLYEWRGPWLYTNVSGYFIAFDAAGLRDVKASAAAFIEQWEAGDRIARVKRTRHHSHGDIRSAVGTDTRQTMALSLGERRVELIQRASLSHGGHHFRLIRSTAPRCRPGNRSRSSSLQRALGPCWRCLRNLARSKTAL